MLDFYLDNPLRTGLVYTHELVYTKVWIPGLRQLGPWRGGGCAMGTPSMAKHRALRLLGGAGLASGAFAGVAAAGATRTPGIPLGALLVVPLTAILVAVSIALVDQLPQLIYLTMCRKIVRRGCRCIETVEDAVRLLGALPDALPGDGEAFAITVGIVAGPDADSGRADRGRDGSAARPRRVRCAVCNRMIHATDEVRRTVKGKLAHDGCVSAKAQHQSVESLRERGASAPITARYSDICARCGKRYAAGTKIVKTENGWVHGNCRAQAEVKRRESAV